MYHDKEGWYLYKSPKPAFVGLKYVILDNGNQETLPKNMYRLQEKLALLSDNYLKIEVREILIGPLSNPYGFPHIGCLTPSQRVPTRAHKSLVDGCLLRYRSIGDDVGDVRPTRLAPFELSWRLKTQV